ncbi:MAG: hypothetical protein COS58_01540 [Candidatus Tagabacteria bacterium CG03_land_8_20_14_0_80_41_22]|uniref:Uncharacterized protein n=1 Tax=Candidatus Tagabacteria bacterium CG03_land_8_20_14_0_80_41_22 TaxID=1975020 RepID=A0A2M7B8W2_9BACT|nr:MAG: hypothetical protein COV90_00815 [Candidatus Tagabacteria bacterium CG11_big_fil_rev_8_21_14_0_20_41_11]PIU99552.1 MAG: hypothetical protein COS58_01540 [Candidatus Tagabacteria bacterium CG03_land_8_20_14_0_80_41_22]
MEEKEIKKQEGAPLLNPNNELLTEWAGKILYPEFEAMENKIAELKEKLQEKDKQLRYSLETWTYLAHEIDSALSRANSRIYAMMNEIGKE